MKRNRITVTGGGDQGILKASSRGLAVEPRGCNEGRDALTAWTGPASKKTAGLSFFFFSMTSPTILSTDCEHRTGKAHRRTER